MSTIPCPNCGAANEEARDTCSYCDSALRAPVETWEATCAAFLKTLDKELSGSTPFSCLGCLGLLAGYPAIYVGVTQYAGWGIPLAIGILLGYSLFGMMAFSYVIDWEKASLYRRKVRPQVLAFLEKHDRKGEDLLRVARATLEEKNDLLEFLAEFYT